MKSFSLLLVFLVFISCNDSNKSDLSGSKLIFVTQIVFKNGEEKKYTSYDYIKWYNAKTKEISFYESSSIHPSPQISDQNVLSREDGIYLSEDSTSIPFEAVTEAKSDPIADLVLFSTLEGKCYLSFGFPSSKIDLLSPIPEDAESWYTEAMIKENYKKREAEWTKFIQQLKTEGKYIN